MDNDNPRYIGWRVQPPSCCNHQLTDLYNHSWTKAKKQTGHLGYSIHKQTNTLFFLTKNISVFFSNNAQRTKIGKSLRFWASDHLGRHLEPGPNLQELVWGKLWKICRKQWWKPIKRPGDSCRHSLCPILEEKDSKHLGYTLKNKFINPNLDIRFRPWEFMGPIPSGDFKSPRSPRCSA